MGRTSTLPADKQFRFVEGSDVTFQISGAALAGKAAPIILSVINFFGLQNEISTGLAAQEPKIQELLHKTKMPGVLIWVEAETSKSDVEITKLVTGKPKVVGPGLNQLSTFEAYIQAGNEDLTGIDDGYRRNDDASSFLWAKEVDGHVEYGLTYAPFIMNEARRELSD